MKCVVFGGGGFIGSAICDRLLLDGHSLRVFERPRVLPYRDFLAHENVEWITGDLLNSHEVSKALVDAEIVLHLVSTTLPKSSNEAPIYDVQSNLVATLQMLEAMVAKNIRRIIFISSGGTVYGNPAYLPVDESHPTEPNVSYGITKLAIEKYILMYQKLYGIKASILRVSNPYGERQRIETSQGAVGIFLARAMRSETIEIWGDGQLIRDYLYVGDVADAFASAVKYSGTESVFNISSNIGTSLDQLLCIIEDILDIPVERSYLPSRSFDVQSNILENRRARLELGWEPRVKLHEGVRLTAEWMRAHYGM